MIYIVDIDNTICHSPTNDYTKSTPYPDRIEKINELYDKGHYVIYWTARGGNTGIDWSEFTSNQLYNWGCVYHELRMKKPSYDVWIDDKAFNSEDFF